MQYRLENKKANQKINQALSAIPGDETNETYLRQIMVTAGKLAEDDIGELELKLLTNSLKEMRYAFKVFQKYENRKKIAVFGSSRTGDDHPNYRAAERLSSEAADRGYMIISGAGPGIMEAANKGAGAEASFGLHITIPSEQHPNPYIKNDEKCISFRYFFTRKLLFAKECQAVVFFPGGYGTHDELFELLCLTQTGRHHLTPIILCDRNGFWEQGLDYLKENLLEENTIKNSDLQHIDYVSDPLKALNVVDLFYSNFHSSRFLEQEYVIRFKELPDHNVLSRLEDEFLHLCPKSGFRVEQGPLEGEEPEAPENLYRLVFSFTNKDYGELRRLIDYINEWG